MRPQTPIFLFPSSLPYLDRECESDIDRISRAYVPDAIFSTSSVSLRILREGI